MCASEQEHLIESASEDRLRRVTIGEPRVLDDRITLVEYSEKWPDQFEGEAARLRNALGNRALKIHHIGSTSVPGLIAKPIIDVVLVVASSADEASYVPALEAAGYILHIREPDWHEHRLFKGQDIDLNIHVFSRGDDEIGRLLLLRDHLRSNQQDRELYAQTKRELAERRWKYTQDYADAKSDVVEGILKRASADVPEPRSP